jgi:hypothetical protein
MCGINMSWNHSEYWIMGQDNGGKKGKSWDLSFEIELEPHIFRIIQRVYLYKKEWKKQGKRASKNYKEEIKPYSARKIGDNPSW